MRHLIYRNILALILPLTFVACGPGHWQEPLDNGATKSDAVSDLSNSDKDLSLEASSVYKSERLFRKFRLAAAVAAKSLEFNGPTVDSCLAQGSFKNDGEFAFKCQDTQGKVTVLNNSAGRHITIFATTTKIPDLDSVTQVLAITNINLELIQGKKVVGFDFSFTLHKGEGAEQSSRICSSLSNRQYAVYTEPEGNTESINRRLTDLMIQNITLSCDNAQTPFQADDTFLTLRPSQITLSPAQYLMSGNVGFAFQKAGDGYSGTYVLTTEKVKESAKGITQQWRCLGDLVCFP